MIYNAALLNHEDDVMGQPFSKPQSKHQSSSSLVIVESKKTSDSKGIAIIDKTKINAANAALVMANVNERVNLVNIDCLQRFSLDLVAIIFGYANLLDMVRYDIAYRGLTTNLGIFTPNQNYITECKQAETIARNHILTAGPLDALEKEARQNPIALLRPIRITMALDGIEFTFEGSPLQLATMLLDQTITQAEDSTVPMIDEGQAERLMSVIEDCLRDRIPEAQVQARVAAPEEDEEKSKVEKDKELEVFGNAFNAIKANNFDAARNIIWNYIISTKPAVITDNQYFLKLFRLIPRALNFLVAQFNKAKDGEWDWNKAAQFCIRTIGTIERVLPHKLRKVLRTELYYMLYQGRNLNRSLDSSDASYLAVGGLELAVSCFFDDLRVAALRWRAGSGWHFSSLYQQLHQRSKSYAAIEHSSEERCLDSESRRSP